MTSGVFVTVLVVHRIKSVKIHKPVIVENGESFFVRNKISVTLGTKVHMCTGLQYDDNFPKINTLQLYASMIEYMRQNDFKNTFDRESGLAGGSSAVP